jgi:hypothetical protein
LFANQQIAELRDIKRNYHKRKSKEKVSFTCFRHSIALSRVKTTMYISSASSQWFFISTVRIARSDAKKICAKLQATDIGSVKKESKKLCWYVSETISGGLWIIQARKG